MEIVREINEEKNSQRIVEDEIVLPCYYHRGAFEGEWGSRDGVHSHGENFADCKGFFVSVRVSGNFRCVLRLKKL